ncbi:phage antirepressor KilAC domain-containing protein [Auritidibacter sp. NML100628]|uniref:phage antirepressor KilAC domain-containing protein n=1 Tax=Auritidibacter sp. NML100628 TaxID=2170742 RepID=UPI001F18AFB9|nr:phage antirepressor KilAC domain-containing protein [Auritidibacter sp. NML100628]
MAPSKPGSSPKVTSTASSSRESLPLPKLSSPGGVDEVLPSIRRHGVYAIEEIRSNPRALLAALEALIAEQERNDALVAENLVQAQLILKSRPKISYYDLVLQSDSLITTTEIAKDYGLSVKRLNQILHEEGVQFHRSGRWFLYAPFTQEGYAQSETHEYDAGKTRTHMYWTKKGRLFMYDLLKNQCGLLPVIEQNDCGAA